MKKKIFVNKDAQSGFRSSLKFLLWAAVALVVLVLFIPLTSRQKAGREVTKKPAVEKGKVVKEIPRSLQPIAESISRGQGESADAPKEVDSRPSATSEGKPGGTVSATAPSTAPKDKPAESPGVPQKVEPAVEGGQKGLAGRPPTSEPAPIQGLKETPPTPAVGDPARATQTASDKKPEPAPPAATEARPKSMAAVPAPGKPAKPAAPEARPAAAGVESQKPTAVAGQKLYSVQVATLKDKRSAEELKKALQKKGFEVVMKTTGDPKQGQSFTLQLQPVDNIGKASTMMEQVKYVPQAKPSIVTVNKE